MNIFVLKKVVNHWDHFDIRLHWSIKSIAQGERVASEVKFQRTISEGGESHKTSKAEVDF